MDSSLLNQINLYIEKNKSIKSSNVENLEFKQEILKVDNEDVDKISFNGAAAKIRGKKGTKVKLTV